MNNSSGEKLSKVLSVKVTLEDYNLCKGIVANLYEIGRDSVSELVRILVGALLSECRNKQQNIDRNYSSRYKVIWKIIIIMQSPMEQQLMFFTMPCSLIHTLEYHNNQMYEQQKEKNKNTIRINSFMI